MQLAGLPGLNKDAALNWNISENKDQPTKVIGFQTVITVPQKGSYLT